MPVLSPATYYCDKAGSLATAISRKAEKRRNDKPKPPRHDRGRGAPADCSSNDRPGTGPPDGPTKSQTEIRGRPQGYLTYDDSCDTQDNHGRHHEMPDQTNPAGRYGKPNIQPNGLPALQIRSTLQVYDTWRSQPFHERNQIGPIRFPAPRSR